MNKLLVIILIIILFLTFFFQNVKKFTKEGYGSSNIIWKTVNMYYNPSYEISDFAKGADADYSNPPINVGGESKIFTGYLQLNTSTTPATIIGFYDASNYNASNPTNLLVQPPSNQYGLWGKYKDGSNDVNTFNINEVVSPGRPTYATTNCPNDICPWRKNTFGRSGMFFKSTPALQSINSAPIWVFATTIQFYAEFGMISYNNTIDNNNGFTFNSYITTVSTGGSSDPNWNKPFRLTYSDNGPPVPCTSNDWEVTGCTPCPTNCGSSSGNQPGCKITKKKDSANCTGNVGQNSISIPTCNAGTCSECTFTSSDSPCSATACGTSGTITRSYNVNNSPCHGSTTKASEKIACNAPACVACTYSDWADVYPTGCPNCGANATKHQTRTATNNGANDCNQPTTRIVSCGVPACECAYSAWDDPPCSKSCGGGTRNLKRSIIQQNDTNSCNDTTQNNAPCPPNPCPPCTYGAIDQSTLNACSAECGGGTQTGYLLVSNKNGNDNCPTKMDTQSCNTQGCPIVTKIIPYQYQEYWNLYLSDEYNVASNFTIDQPFSLKNSSFKDNFFRINSQNAEQYREKLMVGTYALIIDRMSITLPYTTYYYYNNSQNGVLQITNGSAAVTTLQLNNNNNNFGKVLNAIYINGNGVPQVFHSQMYFLTGSIDTAKFSIYMIVAKNPQILKAKQLLSCTVPGVGKQSRCMISTPGQNMAVSFTVNLKSANNTANKQQIIGISMDAGGDEQIVFGAWICAQSNALMIQRASASNPQNVISNCKVLLDVGLDNAIYVLFNGQKNLYEIYKNNVLVDTNIPTEAPKYNTGSCYIFTSFNSYGVVNGTLSDVVYLASDHKTFATDDLDQAINYMNNNIDLSSMEKPVQEGFSNVYTPLPNGSYNVQDLRNMQAELIVELNDFNRQYSYYKKYMYNNRHTVAGDTSQLFLKEDKSKIGPADFPNLDINVPLNEVDIYKNLLGDLNIFNQALNASVNLHTNTGQISDINKMQERENEVVKIRKTLDSHLMELNEIEGSMASDSKRSMNSTLFVNILWTSIASSLVYLVFVHT